MRCPICTQPLEGGELVMVCTPCHRGLAGPDGSGGLAVNATGEFRVPSPEQLEAMMAMGTADRPATAAACSWCNKTEPQVKKLLGRGTVALCDECVALCCDILDAELGHWR
jgi:hypothetical protein